MRNMRLKAALGMAGVLAMTAACCVVGPALAADSASTADEIVRGGEPDGDVQYPGKEYIVENYDKWDKIAEEYAPEIIRYSNGQLVQRTPTEYECPPLDAAKLDHFVQHVLPRRGQPRVQFVPC